jgi:hypothetical protein
MNAFLSNYLAACGLMVALPRAIAAATPPARALMPTAPASKRAGRPFVPPVS